MKYALVIPAGTIHWGSVDPDANVLERLRHLQSEVGGYMESVTITPTITALMSEERRGRADNPTAALMMRTLARRRLRSQIHGPVVFIGTDRTDICGLSTKDSAAIRRAHSAAAFLSAVEGKS